MVVLRGGHWSNGDGVIRIVPLTRRAGQLAFELDDVQLELVT